MNNNPFYKSIKELRNIYEKKEASVSEISNAFIQRIKNLNPKINAYLEVFEKESNSDAKKADSYINNGNKNILTGIIIGLKDLVDVKGKITSAGSKILEKNIAKSNSKITNDFIEQKSVILGKTNLVEFAFGTLGINTNTPTCRNPWDLEKVPGGSSSGSAAAVSAGLCTFAIGTDTGGSVRMPASLCGITGFKPSYGIVSRR
ncbi:MAG: amidase, partial [Chloroflexota bacterium]|nr:amidase [Chloroflexota bacterium]